jgi:hypothetical protein
LAKKPQFHIKKPRKSGHKRVSLRHFPAADRRSQQKMRISAVKNSEKKGQKISQFESFFSIFGCQNERKTHFLHRKRGKKGRFLTKIRNAAKNFKRYQKSPKNKKTIFFKIIFLKSKMQQRQN